MGRSWVGLGRVLGPSWEPSSRLGGVLGAQDGPKLLPRRPKMLLRCLQDSPRSDFQQKSRKNEPLELGWHFPFDFSPILSQKYVPEF